MAPFDRIPTRWLRIIRRAVKVGTAAALATLLAQLLGLQNPWFATLAAIVAMEITIRASVRTARNSLVGAVVGAGAGLGMAFFAKEQFWAVAVVVLVVFVVFGFLRMESAGRQAALVGSVIVLVPERAGVTTTDFAWIRLAETVIGISVALAVNRFLFPPHAYRTVRRDLAAAYQHLAELFGLIASACAGDGADARTVRVARQQTIASLRAVDGLWDEAMSEHPPHEVLAPHWRATTRRIWEQAAVIDTALAAVSTSPLVEQARGEMTALAAALTRSLGDVSNAFRSEQPVSDFPDLGPARTALLDRVQAIEDGRAPSPFSETLQVLGVVNGMSVVAARLIDLRETSHPELEPPPGAAAHDDDGDDEDRREGVIPGSAPS
jgi:uncharacterized membrane protein YccC